MPLPAFTSQPTYQESFKRKSFPFCGRLIVMQKVATEQLSSMLLDPQKSFAGFTAINFPAMPDSVELARRAEYTVASPYGFPDGIHVYKATQPLKIPFSFKLHFADDDYCPNGAKTLLEVAALLEALVAPFGPEDLSVTHGGEEEQGQPNKTDDGKVKNDAEVDSLKLHYTKVANIFPPATCYLELIRTEVDSVGLACIGYVEEVRVRLLGPWMRSSRLATQNLPTAAEYEFTFVHHPGHGNAFRYTENNSERQAFAQTIKDRLFNTIGLLTQPENYRGFKELPTGMTSGDIMKEASQSFRGHGAGGSWDEMTEEQKRQEELNRNRILNSQGFMSR